MRVTVSKTVKTLYGTKWRKGVRHLGRAALAGSEGVTGECFTRRYIKVNIALSEKGTTVTAQPEFLPELEE